MSLLSCNATESPIEPPVHRPSMWEESLKHLQRSSPGGLPPDFGLSPPCPVVIPFRPILLPCRPGSTPTGISPLIPDTRPPDDVVPTSTPGLALPPGPRISSSHPGTLPGTLATLSGNATDPSPPGELLPCSMVDTRHPGCIWMMQPKWGNVEFSVDGQKYLGRFFMSTIRVDGVAPPENDRVLKKLFPLGMPSRAWVKVVRANGGRFNMKVDYEVEVDVCSTNPGERSSEPGELSSDPGTLPGTVATSSCSGTEPSHSGVLPSNPGVLPSNPGGKTWHPGRLLTLKHKSGKVEFVVDGRRWVGHFFIGDVRVNGVLLADNVDKLKKLFTPGIAVNVKVGRANGGGFADDVHYSVEVDFEWPIRYMPMPLVKPIGKAPEVLGVIFPAIVVKVFKKSGIAAFTLNGREERAQFFSSTMRVDWVPVDVNANVKGLVTVGKDVQMFSLEPLNGIGISQVRFRAGANVRVLETPGPQAENFPRVPQLPPTLYVTRDKKISTPSEDDDPRTGLQVNGGVREVKSRSGVAGMLINGREETVWFRYAECNESDKLPDLSSILCAGALVTLKGIVFSGENDVVRRYRGFVDCHGMGINYLDEKSAPTQQPSGSHDETLSDDTDEVMVLTETPTKLVVDEADVVFKPKVLNKHDVVLATITSVNKMSAGSGSATYTNNGGTENALFVLSRLSVNGTKLSPRLYLQFVKRGVEIRLTGFRSCEQKNFAYRAVGVVDIVACNDNVERRVMVSPVGKRDRDAIEDSRDEISGSSADKKPRVIKNDINTLSAVKEVADQDISEKPNVINDGTKTRSVIKTDVDLCDLNRELDYALSVKEEACDDSDGDIVDDVGGDWHPGAEWITLSEFKSDEMET